MENNYVYMTYYETRSGGEQIGDDPNEQWPSFEDENIDFEPYDLFANLTGLNWSETIKVDFDPNEAKANGKKVYVVIVRYSTGDTFSRTNGQWLVIGAYLDKEKAEAICKSIEDNTYEETHQPWQGYFEFLEGVDAHEFTLK